MKRTQPARFELKDGSFLMVDSGIVSRYRPAKRQKPDSIIRRAFRRLRGLINRPNPSLTTEQGSGAASPSTYEHGLWAERYERRQVIQDCRRMIADDPRARRSTLKLAKEATRKGATIVVNLETSPSKRLAKKAQAIAEELQGLLNPAPVQQTATSGKLRSWAWMLLVEGDLFVQAVLKGDRLVDAKRMPAAGMERLSDDTDEFGDPFRAFAQIDVSTNEEVATFPEGLMYHARWCHIDGERYGQPELSSGRRLQKLLEISENAQNIRRIVRAPQRMLWNVGTEENPGKPGDIQEFKETNGFVGGQREIYDPTNVAIDYYGNGPVSAQPIEGDATVHEIEDIVYLQNLYTAAGTPTPGFLYGLDCNSLNRDVMEELRAEWLKEVQDLADEMRMLVAWLFELSLELRGIHPGAIHYTVSLSDSSSEEPTQVIDRIATMKREGLISERRAVQMASEFSGANPEDELAAIKKERREAQEFNVAPIAKGRAQESKNGNGQPKQPAST